MLACPKCRAPVGGRDVNVQEMVATCPACQNLFRFSADDLDPDPGSPDGGTPARFQLNEQGGGWSVSWSWWRWSYMFLIFFCIAWDGFLVFWYSMGASGKHTPLIMFIFPIGHVAVGVSLTYFVLAAMVNRTTVSVERGWLRIAHKPLPWFGQRHVELREIAEVGSRVNRRSDSGPTDYAVMCVIQGKQRRLVGGLEENEANWLVRSLKRLNR